MAGLGHELYGEQPVRAPHDLHMDLIIGFLSDVYRAIPDRTTVRIKALFTQARF